MIYHRYLVIFAKGIVLRYLESFAKSIDLESSKYREIRFMTVMTQERLFAHLQTQE